MPRARGRTTRRIALLACVGSFAVSACVGSDPEVSDDPLPRSVGSGTDAGADTDARGGDTPANDGGAPDQSADGPACATFEEGFDTWPNGNWNVFLSDDAGAQIFPSEGWSGKALSVNFFLVFSAADLVKAWFQRSAKRTPGCDLDIAFDFRPDIDTSGGRHVVLGITGISGARIELRRILDSWELAMGTSVYAIAKGPVLGAVNRVRLLVREVDAHAEAIYTLDGANATVGGKDLAVVPLGTAADVRFGSELRGQTTRNTWSDFDNVRISW